MSLYTYVVFRGKHAGVHALSWYQLELLAGKELHVRRFHDYKEAWVFWRKRKRLPISEVPRDPRLEGLPF